VYPNWLNYAEVTDLAPRYPIRLTVLINELF